MKLKILALVCIFALSLGGPASAIFFTSTSATLPTSGTDDSAVGTVAWSNPGNITASDNTYALFSSSVSGSVSHYLKGLTFGFAIPAGATINGITMVNARKGNFSQIGKDCKDNTLSLVKAGVVESTNKADTSTRWPTTEADATYGSASDLWSSTWTASDINNANFGVVLSAKLTTDGTQDCSVDNFTITVTYTAAAGNPGAGFFMISHAGLREIMDKLFDPARSVQTYTQTRSARAIAASGH
jgi:hypothetical protein